MGRKTHWEELHRTQAPGQRSWFAPKPATSRSLIAAAGIGPSARVIDVGGGASRLVDELVARAVRVTARPRGKHSSLCTACS